MLLGATDPFCGLDILRIRYAAGRRPSTDMAGNALSWLLTGEDHFAQKSLAEMRTPHHLRQVLGRGFRLPNWALTFDWLYEYPAFDEALKDRVAKQLLDGAITDGRDAGFRTSRAGVVSQLHDALPRTDDIRSCAPLPNAALRIQTSKN